MQRRLLLLGIALIFLVVSGFVVIISTSPAFAHVAHSSVYVENPTPTPDANTTLQMAQQEEGNIQTILNIINILVVVYPILITIAAVVLGFFGLRDFLTLRQQGQDLLEDTKKQYKEAQENIQQLKSEIQKDIEDLRRETAEKRAEMERTQQAFIYLNLGDRYSMKDRRQQAIKAYNKAGELLPNDPQIKYVLGRLYSEFGYYEEAIKSFEAVIVLDPQFAEAEMEFGLVYRRRGDHWKGPDAQLKRNQDYEQAIAHLQRALELRPNSDDTLSTLGGVYRRKEEYEKSLEYYERAYRANPSSSYALSNVASLCWYLGKLDKARQYFTLTELASTEYSMMTHPDTYWSYYDLALAQLALGKIEDAKKSYALAINETPSTAQFDSVLDVLYLLRHAKEQIPSLDEVIQMVEEGRSSKAV